jgi:hypothetical protein
VPVDALVQRRQQRAADLARDRPAEEDQQDHRDDLCQGGRGCRLLADVRVRAARVSALPDPEQGRAVVVDDDHADEQRPKPEHAGARPA